MIYPKFERVAFVVAIVFRAASADQVIGVTDGDTLTALSQGLPVRIRLANIDAPEKGQAFGSRSKEALAELCINRDASLDVVGKDRYGRVVAVVYCDGVNVNIDQVINGMAWAYPKYNTDPTLVELEARVREAKLWLWSDGSATAPWRYRKERIKLAFKDR